MKSLSYLVQLVPMLVVISLITGCSAAKSIPSDITLKDALQEVRDGIRLLQEKKEGEKPAGLLVSEVQVNLNITASAKDSTKLGLDLAPGGLVSEIPTGSFEKSSELMLSRSNQITFKFQNLFLASKDTLVGISITPITTTTEKTTTNGKDTQSSTEKVPSVVQPLTLDQLYQLLDNRIIIKSQ